MSYEEYLNEFLEDGMDEEIAEQLASYESFVDFEDSTDYTILYDFRNFFYNLKKGE